MHELAAGNCRSASCLIAILAFTYASAALCDEEHAPGNAGDSVLRGFERSVLPPPDTAAAPPPPRSRRHGDNDIGYELAEELVDFGVQVVADAGRLTLQRLDPGAETESRRNDGDLLIPFLRYDFAHQAVSDSIFGNSHRLEIGYGPFALLLEDTKFHERSPSNTLGVTRQLFLYRLSLNRMVEVDVGLGQTTVRGAQSTALGSMSLPVRFVVSDNVAVEVRPTWSETMQDYEIALSWGRPFGSLKVGYRALVSSGATLDGPFAGFSLYY